jgi:hypothetical protein
MFLKLEFESGIIAHEQLQNFQQKHASKPEVPETC